MRNYAQLRGGEEDMGIDDRENSLRVEVDDKFGIERSLRKFKRMCEAFGVVKEYRKRQEYRKPSVRKLEKTEAAEKRRKKNNFKSGRNSKF